MSLFTSEFQNTSDEHNFWVGENVKKSVNPVLADIRYNTHRQLNLEKASHDNLIKEEMESFVGFVRGFWHLVDMVCYSDPSTTYVEGTKFFLWSRRNITKLMQCI